MIAWNGPSLGAVRFLVSGWGCGLGMLEDMPDGLSGVSELPGDLSDGHAIASRPPNRAVVVHRKHVLGLREVIDSCRNVHHNEGGWGGSRLRAHFAPRWVPPAA